MLVDAIVRQPEDDRQIIPAWYFGVTALWQLDDSSEIWLAYVTDKSLSMDRREKFLFTLLDSPLSATDKVVRLDTLIKEQLPGLHYKALLLRAYALESAETMRQLASEWERLSLEEIQLWATITGKYRAGDIIVGCFRKLQEMDLSDEWIVRIAQSLSFGMRYEVDLYSASSWAGRERILHPNTRECAEMIWAWSIRYRGNLKGRLKVLTAAGDLGHLAAIESLSQELISLINQNDDWFEDFDNDHIIANCLHTLSDQQQQLPLQVLSRCARVSTSNAGRTAVHMLGSFATDEALRELISLYESNTDYWTKDAIVSRIEELAGRLGVRLIREGDKLTIAD